jgi:hypothetical protein
MRSNGVLAAAAVALLACGAAGARPALAQSSTSGVYGGYLGSQQWMRDQNNLARERAMNQALSARNGGTQGGCAQLPAGWAAVDATVQFPASYGGYAGWVNTAELLPVGSDLGSFIKTGHDSHAFTRPALRAGANAVTSHMCAPGQRAYWVIVDSGMARVAVGRIQVGPGPGPYRVSLTAPPLNKQ